MKRWKLIVAIVLGILALIVVFQNTEEVQTKLLFFTVTMSRAALLFGTLLIGVVLGVLLILSLLRKRITVSIQKVTKEENA